MILLNLLYNLSLLYVLFHLSSNISKLLAKNPILKLFTQGILIGLVTIIGMKYSFELESGLIFDGRSIIISTGTMFYGPYAGLIGSLIGGIYRYSIGGVGWLSGLLTFVVSFLAGLIFYLLRKNNEKVWTSNTALLIMGFATHMGVVAIMLFLPKESMIITLQTIAPVMLTLYPLFTLLLGKYHLYLEENEKLNHELLIKENRFRTSLYSIGDGLITTDTLGNIVTMNEVAQKLTGWSEVDAQGKPITQILKLINEETRQDVPNPAEKVLKYGIIVGLANHTLLINKNGEEIPIADSGAPIKDELGNITGVVFVFRDQSAEKEYTKRIQKNQNDLKKAEKIAKIGYWEFDVATQTLIGSDGALSIFEFDHNAIKLQDFRKIVLPEFHPILDKAMFDLINNNIPYDLQFTVVTFTTKTKKQIRSYAEYDKSKNTVFGVLQDITESFNDKKNIEKQKIRLENIIKATKVGTWEWNIQTGEVNHNDYWFEMLGYSPEDFSNPSLELWRQLTHPSDLVNADAVLQDHFEGKTDYYSCEMRMKHKDGHWVWILDSGTVITRSPDGKPIWMYGQHLDITDRKLAEEKLRENEEKYRSLVAQMDQGLALHQAIYDENGKMIDYIFLDINESYEKTVGLSREIIGKRVSEVLPSVEKFWIEAFGKVVETGESIHYENYVEELNQYFEVTAYRNMSDQFAVLLTNTTEKVLARKKLEDLYEKLKDSEERFRLAMDATSDGIWDWNLKTNEVYYSPNYFKMLGYSPTEFKFHYNTWLELLHPEDKESVVSFENNVLETGGSSFSIEYRMRTKSKNWIWILSRGRIVEWDENGKPLRLVGTHSDITARKIYEEEISRTKETYLNIFNTVKEAIYIQNYDGVFLDVNASAERMYGYSKSEIIGKTPEFLSAPNKNNFDNLRKTYEKLIKYGGTAQLEFWGQRSNGEIFPKDVILSVGKYFGQDVIIATARDITAQKQLIEELTEAKDKAVESDLLKSAFLANMSHEIRTPMNAIIGFSQFLEDDELTSEEKSEYLNIINQKGKDLLQLIDDILDLSKIEAGQLTLFLSAGDVATVVYEIVRTFKSQNRIVEYHFDKKVEIRVGKTNPISLECKTDFYRLRQILNNLVSNAMKFTEEGFVEVGYELVDNLIQFYVKDTGIGIHPDSINKIFERFRQEDEYYHTRKYGGAGLGLSICQGLVNALEGNIWVESEFGLGATFFFTIKYVPVNINQEQLVEKVQAPKLRKGKSIKVLIAEDDYSNYQLLRRLLEKYYTVEIIYAKNGQEAIDLTEINNDIDVIFMDIRMPIKNGVQAFNEIRAKGLNMPIIALTAYALIEEKTKIQSAGFDGYITKPLRKEDIIEILEKLDICNS